MVFGLRGLVKDVQGQGPGDGPELLGWKLPLGPFSPRAKEPVMVNVGAL